MGSKARSVAGVMALVVTAVMAGATGCVTQRLGKLGAQEEARGNYDQAVLAYAKLVAMDPTIERWRIALERSKLRSSQVHFEKAKEFRENGQLELAIGELQQVVTLDPANQYAQTELEKALLDWQKERSQETLTELERMKLAARKAQGVPLLDPRSNIPIIINFRDAEVGKIYEALSKATGINFLYDPKLDLKVKVTIELNNVPFEKAMDTLMLTNKHFFKVMDENTILISDDNQQKRREYEDQVIKTFFLSNADVKEVQSLLRTMLDSRKLTQNQQLNAITIRDTPEKVAIAGKIIEMNDKAKSELIIDVELLEVNRTVSRTLGINLTPRQFNIQFEGGDRLPLNDLGLLGQAGLYTLGPIPQVTIDFLKSDSGTRAIVHPQLRVTEGEKASLHIGDSVPIPTTTFNTTGTVGGSVIPVTSFTYQEVGIVITIEPRVHHNREITLTLNVEVSQLGDRVDAGQGISQPSINTRQIDTVIRLKDGETNLLAGLITRAGTSNRAGFPGLVDIPGIRRVFSTQADTNRETDLILTLTPHIIRTPDIRQEDLDALWVGNEANPKLRGDAGSVFATPFTPESFFGSDEEELEGGPEEEVAAAEAPAVQPAASVTTSPAAPPPAQASQPPGEEAGARGQERREAVPAAPPTTEPATPEPEAQPPAEEVQPAAGGEAAGPMNLTIAPARLNVAAGGSFSVNLLVNNVSDLQKIALTLTYDPTSVEFDSGLEGALMKQDGTQTIFSAAKTADGQVTVELERLGGASGISRGGAMASLRFLALAGGKASIAFGPVSAAAFDGRQIEVNAGQADITVVN